MGKKNKRKKNKNYQQNFNQNAQFKKPDQVNDLNRKDDQSINLVQEDIQTCNTYEDRQVHVAEKVEDDFQEGAKFSKKNIFTILVAIVMAIFLTLVILFSTGLLKKDNLSFLPFIEKTGSWQDGDFAFEKKSDLEIEVVESSDKSINKLNIQGDNQKRVKLPVLMTDDQDLKLEGHKIGCDILYWVPIYVPNDENIVSSTIQALFDYDQEFDFMVGNYVAKQKNLNFDEVIVDGQKATIYVSGEITDLNNACDSVRLETQLSWVALQFDHISKVSIYLNGELYSETN